ncbi:MAG: serine/threonine protein kinase, partial [uncultured bacterium]
MNYKPEKIGRYKIQAEIGKGAMGVVYRGLDEDLDRTVAIKMLPKSFIEEGDQSIRFKQEAKIVARLDHPN